MNTFSISEIIDETIDFFKQHYEYILPFSLFYTILSVLLTFIPAGTNLVIQLLILPLGFSYPFFAHRYEQLKVKSFKYFFEVYNYFFKYFGAKIISGIIILILLSPILINMYELLGNYDNDMQKLMQAYIEHKIKLPDNLALPMLICPLLLIFSLPFILYIEYIAIIDNYNLIDALKQSYNIGFRFYTKIFTILLLSFVATFAGLLTLGFGFIVILPFIYLLHYFSYKKISQLAGINS